VSTVGTAGGEWVRELEGAGCGDYCPTRRSPEARPRLNDVPTVVPRRRRRAVATGDGAGDVDVRGDMMTTRIQAGPTVTVCGDVVARAGVSTVVSKTTGVMWGYVPLTRHFSPTIRPADCPSQRPWDIRDNVAVLC